MRTSDCPSRYSIASHARPPSNETSFVCTTFGWFSRAQSRASSRNISRKPLSSASCGFSALSRASLLKPGGPCATARYTQPIPPWASSMMSRYFPRFMDGLATDTPPGLYSTLCSSAHGRVLFRGMRARIFGAIVALALSSSGVAQGADCGADGHPVVYVVGTGKAYVAALAKPLYTDPSPITVVWIGTGSCTAV